MEVMFIDAAYGGEVKLTAETLNYLKGKGCRKIGLYASLAFVSRLAGVKKQLEENRIELSEARQLLGCDIYSLKEADAYLYVGDGRFHPLALVYAQQGRPELKEVISLDPLGNKMTIWGIKEMEKILQKQKASLARFLSSENVGVIISLKPGQEQMKKAFAAQKKFPDKRFYYFIDDRISFDQLENFPFIDVWLNTACPRIALDDSGMFRKGVVNLRDVLEI